jgi:hypothetical protein
MMPGGTTARSCPEAPDAARRNPVYTGGRWGCWLTLGHRFRLSGAVSFVVGTNHPLRCNICYT